MPHDNQTTAWNENNRSSKEFPLRIEAVLINDGMRGRDGGGEFAR